MPPCSIELPSEIGIDNEKGLDHDETRHDRIDTSIVHRGPEILDTTLEPETSSKVPRALVDLEKAVQDGASGSSKEIEASRGQHVPDKSNGRNSLVHEEEKVQYPYGIRLVFLTFGLMATVLMVALDNYILGLLKMSATAIPKISTEFHSLNSVGWFASAYFLTQMAFQPAFGHIFSDVSIKKVYMAAILLFEIGSIVCATANGSVALIVGRLIAGAAGGGLYVGTLTFMGLAVPIRKRPLYISLVTSMFGVASVAGPLLGGVFTDSEKLTWRFCFWINLPIGFVAIILVASSFAAPASPEKSRMSLGNELWKLDPLGVTLLISAFVCLLLALQWAGISYPWSDPRVFGCWLGFGLLILAFFGVQVWRKDKASVPLQLVSQRTVGASCSFLLFISLIVGLLIYYLPLYFQFVQGSSAHDSGIRNLPFLVTMLFAPIASGALISTFGYYVPFMWLGAALATVGSGLLFTLSVDSSNGTLSAYQFVAGLGLGICTQIPFNAVQYILPKEHMTMGSALVSFCNSLGPILGTNIGQAIFSNLLIRRLDQVPGVNATAVVMAGPTNLAAAGTSSTVKEALNYALTRTFVLAVVSGGLAFACSMAMEWGNVKREWKNVKEETQPQGGRTSLAVDR